MTDNRSRHIFHLALGGGERHRFAIAIAAEIAASKGYRVEDMTAWTQSPYVPDLVLKKQDRFIHGPRRNNASVTYWVEIIDTSDPPREWVKLPNEILKIDISRCPGFDGPEGIVETIRRCVP
jgi:hypothetical protein